MLRLIKRNITVEEYLKIVEAAKTAALCDLDPFATFELHDPDSPVFSPLGVKLRLGWPDEKQHTFWDDDDESFLLFPDLMNYIRSKSRALLEDNTPSEEPAKDRMYWEVRKYAKAKNIKGRMYHVYFSLDCKPLGVQCCNCLCPPLCGRADKYIKLSGAQLFLADSETQLTGPVNVELPYQPGDILYIDARPFGKPFYAVYCAETFNDKDFKDFLEGKFRAHGYYMRQHICFHISEDHNSLDHTSLASGLFAGVYFPHAPLDRIKVVENCDNPLLMKASRLLKEDPDVFSTWLALNRGYPRKYLTLDDNEK